MTTSDTLFDDSGSHVPEIERILSYLAWKKTSPRKAAYGIWVHDRFRDEILIPIDTASSDFEHMDRRARNLLSVLHGPVAFARSVAVAEAILSPLDRTEWLEETLAPGLIPVLDGEALFESVREQLAAAAKARQERRPYYGTAARYIARDFLDHSLLGQSGVGSYILTAHTPSEALIYTRAEVPFAAPRRSAQDRVAYSGRQVMNTFDSAVGKIVDALDQPADDAVQDIVQLVPAGISFELVRALARFIRGTDSAIKAERPTSGKKIARREYAFKAQWGSTLERSAIRLVQDPEPMSTSIRGIVTSVAHEPDSPDRVVRIFTETGTRLRVRLNPEQYDEAISAHRSESLVSVKGLVEREGRYAWIYSPDDFVVLADNDDSGPFDLS